MHMSTGQPKKVFSEQELDHSLQKVEIASPKEDIPTISSGPFAVFRLRRTEIELPTPEVDAVAISEKVEDACHWSKEDASGPFPNPSDILDPTRRNMDIGDLVAQVPTEVDVHSDNNSLEPYSIAEDLFRVSESDWPHLTSTLQSDADAGVAPSQGSASYRQVSSVEISTPVTSPARSTPNLNPSFPKTSAVFNIEALSVPTDIRYILHHYVNHVVDLMTVITTPKGPWKSIHLPRALQGIGEFAVSGSTSHARNALFHALLSISAYNLAARHTLAAQEAQAQNWRETALRCRARSLKHLKACLHDDCSHAKRGKYKEVLAAMLSMITIDVCSGETRSSEWHLKGLESFIDHSRSGTKSSYSKKAQSLHMVYFYLRVMRESTDLRCDGVPANPASFSPDLPWLAKPLCFLDESDVTEDWVRGRTETESNVDLSGCEFVYGIPFDLLVLMSKTSGIIRRMMRFQQTFPTSAMPQVLLTLNDELESQILDWPVDQVVSKLSNLPIEEGLCRLIEHQTRAFHLAIIIYYSRLVRHIHRRHLQQYAENIIDHLDAIEVIKYRDDLSTGCILWPAFIGATESISQDLHARYLQWFQSVRYYGLGSYDKAHEVVLEVWDRQRSGNAADGWPAVIDEKDIRLMLT